MRKRITLPRLRDNVLFQELSAMSANIRAKRKYHYDSEFAIPPDADDHLSDILNNCWKGRWQNSDSVLQHTLSALIKDGDAEPFKAAFEGNLARIYKEEADTLTEIADHLATLAHSVFYSVNERHRATAITDLVEWISKQIEDDWTATALNIRIQLATKFDWRISNTKRFAIDATEQRHTAAKKVAAELAEHAFQSIEPMARQMPETIIGLIDMQPYIPGEARERFNLLKKELVMGNYKDEKDGNHIETFKQISKMGFRNKAEHKDSLNKARGIVLDYIQHYDLPLDIPTEREAELEALHPAILFRDLLRNARDAFTDAEAQAGAARAYEAEIATEAAKIFLAKPWPQTTYAANFELIKELIREMRSDAPELLELAKFYINLTDGRNLSCAKEERLKCLLELHMTCKHSLAAQKQIFGIIAKEYLEIVEAESRESEGSGNIDSRGHQAMCDLYTRSKTDPDQQEEIGRIIAGCIKPAPNAALTDDQEFWLGQLGRLMTHTADKNSDLYRNCVKFCTGLDISTISKTQRQLWLNAVNVMFNNAADYDMVLSHHSIGNRKVVRRLCLLTSLALHEIVQNNGCDAYLAVKDDPSVGRVSQSLRHHVVVVVRCADGWMSFDIANAEITPIAKELFHPPEYQAKLLANNMEGLLGEDDFGMAITPDKFASKYRRLIAALQNSGIVLHPDVVAPTTLAATFRPNSKEFTRAAVHEFA